MFTSDTVGKSEPQTHTSKFAFADERLKQSYANLLGDTRAAIDNLESDPFRRVDQRNFTCGGPLPFRAAWQPLSSRL